jgi:hypothetical protein
MPVPNLDHLTFYDARSSRLLSPAVAVYPSSPASPLPSADTTNPNQANTLGQGKGTNVNLDQAAYKSLHLVVLMSSSSSCIH